VTAEMFYTNESHGKFTGVVDRAGGKMYGVYVENGVGHRVTYSRSLDLLEWEDAPVADTGK